MKYAKIITRERIEYAPHNRGAVSNWDQDEKAVLNAGYLPIVEVDKRPDNKDLDMFDHIYIRENGKIIERYVAKPVEAVVEPTLEEKVSALENETGLTRAVREMVLADGSGASEYVRAKAQEIEELAAQLRKE